MNFEDAGYELRCLMRQRGNLYRLNEECTDLLLELKSGKKLRVSFHEEENPPVIRLFVQDPTNEVLLGNLVETLTGNDISKVQIITALYMAVGKTV